MAEKARFQVLSLRHHHFLHRRAMRGYLAAMRGKSRGTWLGAGRGKLAAWLAVAFLAIAGPALAMTMADAGGPSPSLDLRPFFAFVDTDQRDAPIAKLGGPANGLNDTLLLHANGPGPRFHWFVVGLTNSGRVPADSVISVPAQGFVGSGLLWPRTPGSQIVNHAEAGVSAFQPLPVAGMAAYSLALEPGKTATLAFEFAGPVPATVTLWQRNAFEASNAYYAFFRGALLGIAALLAVAMFALYGFRARTAFLAAGALALAGLAFMALEAGHLQSILDAIQFPGLSVETARAVIEGLMAAFLILYLVEISELRRLLPVVGNLVLAAGFLALAIPVIGFAEPAIASGIARIAFGITAASGFALVFYFWRRGEAKAETALVSWSAILLWSFLALIAVLADSHTTALSPLLLAGLCMVLVLMGFTLTHHAFTEGYLSRHFFREAGRRALALAGARAYVWDWQPDEGELHVGEELEPALGLEPGLLAEAGVDGFMEIMHPSDRAAYLAAVGAAEQQGTGAIEREFRLRHGDGGYRWFQLRGRAMPGHGRRAARCIGTLTDVTNAKRSEERLLTDAVYDRVTSLPNRALFLDRLSRALAPQAKADIAGLYVLLIDIDRFKTVNEALGHEAGDNLLTVIGRRLGTEMGTGDSLARMPGDQFAVLFAGGEVGRDIVAFSEALRKAVARPINLDSREIFLTASIGVASAREDGVSAEQMLKDAAIALYEAKRRGVDQVEVFHPSMRDDRAELVVLESELRHAIARNEIEVHYQPIARLADMNLAGFEALVRWRHPALGLLAPESFIGFAEQTGMIKDIGRAVLNEAGRQLGIWQRAYRPAEPLFVAVNISSAQLLETDLIDDIKQVIHREGVRRESLKIEVTESLVMQYPERASQILDRLKELGVGLACDDFGTGYSSLSSLRKLPFDTLKVDQSFIAADGDGERAQIILEAIITMGQSLGLSIVAEGIENQDQVDRLGELDCDMGQGFFIGRPMTAKQVNEALAGLPYASGSGRTAITWLWEKAAKESAPLPVARDVTEARSAEIPKEEPAASETPVAEAPEPEPVKLLTPPLGRAPFAPRVTKPHAEEASPETPPAANGFPAASETPPGTKPRRRKRKKRHAAQQQPV
jgi:diguanylate cyclase (GGDEF)-like protein